MTSTVDLTVVVPWLEGGGAQAALERLMLKLPHVRSRLVVAFAGSRNDVRTRSLFDDVVDLAQARTPRGAWSASRALRPLLRCTERLYSLTRASSVVLGLVPRPASLPPSALTFHMLPSSDRQQLTGRAEELVLRRVTRVASLVTSPSERAVCELVDMGLSPAARTRFVPNLLKEPDPAPPVLPAGGTPVRVLCAGRLERQKGFDLIPWWLSEATSPVHVRVVGDGSQRGALVDAALAVPSPHRVDVLGHVDDLTGDLDWSDAVFMPSRDELNPMLVWEAWQRGRPVLAADLPVFRDLAAVGPLRPVEDPSDFSRGLSALEFDASSSFERSLHAVTSREKSPDPLLTFLEGSR